MNSMATNQFRGQNTVRRAPVPQARAELFEQDPDNAFLDNAPLFGEKVYQAFPTARDEIKTSATCLALELHDAVIFHLMRASERGMRALANHLRVKIKKTRKANGAINCPRCNLLITPAIPANARSVPLDYTMWEEVLKALKGKIDNIQRSAKGKARDSQYDFYQGLEIELNAYMDLWRNDISYCRRSFGELEANQVFVHVKAFMQKLASRLSE